MHTRTQEKRVVTPQKTDPDLPVSVQESPAEAWVGGDLLQGQGQLNMTVDKQDFLKEVTITAITSTIVWPQAKPQGGNTMCCPRTAPPPPTHTVSRKLKIY